MKVSQLIPSVRREVERPFKEKLRHAQQLVRMFANKNACVACSFGKDSTVVLWLALQENPNISVVFNNTGIEWPETLAFREQMKEVWNLNLIETKPKTSFWQVLEKIQKTHAILDDGQKHSNQCCYVLKHAPFREVVKSYGFTHSFTGLTALESRHRMFTACEHGQEYYSKKEGLWKIHPILYWTPEEVWAFITKLQMPVNLAYSKYRLDRLGCMFCLSHMGWREQIARTKPEAYKFIQETYFRQKVLA